MANTSPFTTNDNVYDELFQEPYLPDEEYELFNLSLPDDRLQKMLVNSLDKDRDYWNQKPWNLQDTDLENVKFWLGDQLSDKEFLRYDTSYVDNRVFESTRAILSYATGQLAVPEVIPSRSDDAYVKMARSIQTAMYQHAADEMVDQKARAAVLNLILRKRAFLKLRYDPNKGTYGDIVTEVCNPEDIIIDRYAKFGDNPNIIYHRIRCTVEELCAKFPAKATEIYTLFGIKQGRFTQTNRVITYFEAWFTYMDAKRIPREGVAWFLHDPAPLILDKMPNPNWIYTGDDKKDKETNVAFMPPKPFIWFNYLNLGNSFIDETTLFDQAKPLQRLLNKRLRQINENADYVNGRWVASRKALNEEDATKFINKGSKTVLLVNSEDVGKAVQVIAPQELPTWVYETLQDTRNEIDGIMGTPSIFKGDNPQNSDTLGRDTLLKQQASMLQDDLVRCVQLGMEMYYNKLLQMMRVYYTDDYWFQVKGGDGKFDFVMLNGDTIDSNVKIGVQVDSTLPLDKASIRATAIELAKMNRIDQLTLLEDLGLPDPEIRTERFLRSTIDPLTYLSSVETQIDSNDAEVDIMLLKADKVPEERDDYDEQYLNYFNHFITTNEYAKLPQQTQQVLNQFLTEVTQRAQRTEQLNAPMLDEAGILNQPITPPLPKKTIQIRGMLDPQDSATEANLPQPQQSISQPQVPNTQGLQQPPPVPPK